MKFYWVRALFIVLVRYPVHTPVRTPMYGLPLSQSDQRIHSVFQSVYNKKQNNLSLISFEKFYRQNDISDSDYHSPGLRGLLHSDWLTHYLTFVWSSLLKIPTCRIQFRVTSAIYMKTSTRSIQNQDLSVKISHLRNRQKDINFHLKPCKYGSCTVVSMPKVVEGILKVRFHYDGYGKEFDEFRHVEEITALEAAKIREYIQ